MAEWPARGETPWDDLLKAYIDEAAAAGGGGGGGESNVAVTRFKSPMDPLFGATGDGTTDDQNALEACFEWAGENNGMVIIDRPYGFSDKIKHYGGMSVLQTALPRILAVPDGEEPGLIALSDEAWYQYGDGADGSGSANDNPGPIRGLYLDGKGIAGGGDGLFVQDSAQSSLYDMMVSNSIGVGVNVGRTQNNNFFNLQVGACEGAGVLLKPLDAGQQGPGHNIFVGGHIHDCYLPVHVTSHGSGDFFFPHDNVFLATLIETGRVEDQPVRVAVLLESGQTQFVDVNITYGAQVGTGGNNVEEDCCILVDNPHYTLYPTVLQYRGGTIGGGANDVSDAIRVKQSGAFNDIHLTDNVGIANVDHVLNMDGSVLGAGSDLTGSIDPIRVISGTPTMFRETNGGSVAGLLEKALTPLSFEVDSDGGGAAIVGNVLRVKRGGDTYNRYTLDRDGTHTWRDPATNAEIGKLLRNGAIWGVTGAFTVANAFARTAGSQSLAADAAVTIDNLVYSAFYITFTANGADATSVTINNTLADRVLRIGITGVAGGVNSINWDAGTAIQFAGLGPQPIPGVTQYIEIARVGSNLVEMWRSHRQEIHVAESGDPEGDGQPAGTLIARPA